MPIHTRFRAHLALVAVLLVACVPVTVNITFPQEKLNRAADSIEDMVRSPENPKPPTEPAPKPAAPSSRLESVLAALAPRDAAAQGQQINVVPEVKIQTPQLMKAIESRRGRLPKIQEWQARGCIGETNQGLLEARPGQGCTGEVGSLIGAENADREFIYAELMRQNNIPARDASRVRAAFARKDREAARPGEWIQLDNGQWVKK